MNTNTQMCSRVRPASLSPPAMDLDHREKSSSASPDDGSEPQKDPEDIVHVESAPATTSTISDEKLLGAS
jgi:hypothetical protein